MRLLVHDYGRYAFTYELAVKLAQRGHEVVYAFSDLDSVRADLGDDVGGRLTLLPIKGGEKLVKDSLFKRYQIEVNHGKILGNHIRRIRPDVILSGNTPLEAQWRMMAAAKEVNARFLYWMQDILSIAAHRILPAKLPVVGNLVAKHMENLERKMARASEGVVVIANGFVETLNQWNVDGRKVSVIENWAPAIGAAEAEQVAKWKKEHGIDGKRVILYSGTLGMKHKPELLLELADKLNSREDVALVVIAEGPGADWLREQVAANPKKNLQILSFQPFSMMPTTLGSSDVLIVLLEADAGEFCVPSKTLTYMRAAKPILGGMPLSNLASQIVMRERMGYVVEPHDVDGFVEKGLALIDNPALSSEMGANAKAYADSTFDLESISTKFEMLMQAVHKEGRTEGTAAPATATAPKAGVS